MDKLANFLEKNYKYINFSVVIVNLITIIFGAITIIFWQSKIALTCTILLIPIIFILSIYFLHSFTCLKIKKMDLSDKKILLNLDSIIFSILFILGFGLIGFNFSSLYMLVVLCLSFCYLSITYNYRKSLIQDLIVKEPEKTKKSSNKKKG